MIGAWLAIALLSASWLFGLRIYHAPNWWAWTGMLVLGCAFLQNAIRRVPPRRESVIALVLLIPFLCLAPWPTASRRTWTSFPRNCSVHARLSYFPLFVICQGGCAVPYLNVVV